MLSSPGALLPTSSFEPIISFSTSGFEFCRSLPLLSRVVIEAFVGLASKDRDGEAEALLELG